MTSIPHLAGTEGDLTSAKYVENEWKRQRLDMVQKTSYDVYLDYPDENKYNSIEILNKDLSVDKLFEIKEKVLDSDEDYSKISKPFLAYSINGSFNFVGCIKKLHDYLRTFFFQVRFSKNDSIWRMIYSLYINVKSGDS